MLTDARERFSNPWRLTVLWLLIVGIAFGTPSVGTVAAQEDTGNTVNVELILDLSGSMGQQIGNGETRMAAAKRVLNEVIDALPETEGVNVGFRIYGHEGNNSNAGRAESCESTALVVPIDGVDKPAMRAQVDAASPTGWTPLALSLAAAEEDFPTAEENVLNNIVLLTDGEETCGGNPCETAAAIRDGDRQIRTHVVGFALTEEQSELINCIADEGNGLNLRAANALELSEALFSVLQEIEVVEQFGLLEIEAFGNIFPASTVTFVPGPDQTPRPPVLLQTANTAELPVGSYVVSWVNPSGESTQLDVTIEPDTRTWIRGSLLRLPQGGGEVYTVTDATGVTIWEGPLELGTVIWVLPGIYGFELVQATGNSALVSAEVQTIPGTVTGFEVWTAP